MILKIVRNIGRFPDQEASATSWVHIVFSSKFSPAMFWFLNDSYKFLLSIHLQSALKALGDFCGVVGNSGLVVILPLATIYRFLYGRPTGSPIASANFIHTHDGVCPTVSPFHIKAKVENKRSSFSN